MLLISLFRRANGIAKFWDRLERAYERIIRFRKKWLDL